MKNNRSFKWLQTIAFVIVIFGAAGSLYFVINAGRNNDSFILRGLFIVWVLSPFAALLIADHIFKHSLLLSRKAIYWLMLIVSLGSFICYSSAPYSSHPKAFIFLIAPLVAWLLMITVTLTIAIFKSKSTENAGNNLYTIKKRKLPLITLFTWCAIAGNIVFILWIIFNGIDEGFKATLPEKISYLTLIALLITNVFIILRSKVSLNQI